MTATRRPLILIADDDPDDRLLVSRALGKAGLAGHIHTVHDGEELLDYLQQDGAFLPGLILLDLNMPRMDGWEALRRIRASPMLRSIPIVVLTTSDAPDHITQSYEMGVNAYVVKPSSLDEMDRFADVLEEFWLQIAKLPVRRLSYP